MAKKTIGFEEGGAKKRPEPGMVLLRAPASMVGSGVQGQEIGSDRLVEIEEARADELVRAHGFERVKG